MKNIIVIGSGFSGLACATVLADAGHNVTILEKNKTPGGRARKFEVEGFTFDMGPSWYWMPEVFEQYFARFGKKVSDYYNLTRLDPSYRVYFDNDDYVDIPSNYKDLLKLFENIEEGASQKLEVFLNEAAYKYNVGMNEFVWKPGHSIMEFFDKKVLSSVFKLQMFTSISKHIRSLFKNPKLIQILEFPVLFLGAKPQNTPALYSLMNHADLKLGTWYPQGGMYKIIEGMVNLAKEKGVKIAYEHEVNHLAIADKSIYQVNTLKKNFDCDYVIASADYHHVEQTLLDKRYRKYSNNYWDNRKMAPSSLLFYIGLNRRIGSVQHHTLFFDTDFNLHADEIYKSEKWPSQPLFYMCTPSISDKSISPPNCENLFLLMPIAPGLEDSENIREKYFNILANRLVNHLRIDIREHILFKKSYCVSDFKQDYNAFKGNAYGLANTLDQTAVLKPSIKNKKVKNLYFTGQLTVPGPGVPPSIISGQLVASELIKDIK